MMNVKYLLIIWFGCCMLYGCSTQAPDGESQYREFAPDGIPFTVTDSVWKVDMRGNHRAIVTVDKATHHAVVATLPWRRADLRPTTKKIIVVDAGTDKEIKNISIQELSSEKGVIAFQPETVPGKYYIYFLPFKFKTFMGGGPRYSQWNDYLEPEYEADAAWEKEVRDNWSTIPQAKVDRFEARSKFDFFTPMGLIATADEVQSVLEKDQNDFIVFAEDRAYPIRLTRTIPVRWAMNGPSRKLEGAASPNEYYTWQIGLWASKKRLENVNLEFSDFTHSSGKNTIGKSEITCFNLGGINWDGEPVKFEVDVPEKKIQAMWCGLQVPENIRSGKYTGTVTVSVRGVAPQVVDVVIHVGKEVLADKGDNDLWRHSRLRWLNSTIGMDNLPVTPCENMQLSGNQIIATGKTFLVGKNGLPESVEINGRQVLARPVEFIVKTEKGDIPFRADNITVAKEADGLIEWSASSEQNGLKFQCLAYMEFDGYARYHINLSSSGKEITANDIELVIPYTPVASEYFMGIGYHSYSGGYRPTSYIWDWDGPWDSFWMGGDKAGMHVEFRGGTYHGPLQRDYKVAPPKTWYNNGSGNIRLAGNNGQVATVTASTGKTKISANAMDFEFALLITPVKPVNPAKHFSERYCHSLGAFPKAAEDGVNITVLHHSTHLNPVINYPFIVRDSLVSLIKRHHKENRMIKLYYTVRELTNYTAEIYALKSLNHEIFTSGIGYGTPWLCEHLIDDYKGAWYSELPGQFSDAAIVVNGFSRWINYYLEGLRWMFENYEIDGVYMDDVAFDREVMKRMRKIIARYRPTALIDLHSSETYSMGPFNQYAGFFPYIDRIWFGESYQYNKMTHDEWFVTFSGIPLGLMGELSEDKGIPPLGMVYGTTGRHSYGKSPAPVWKLWKEFNIETSKMLGYWDENCPVKTNQANVKATAFVHPDKILISVGNFDSKDQVIRLSFDWKKLGLDPSKVHLYAPSVENFQDEKTFGINEPIPVESKGGWLLILSGNK